MKHTPGPWRARELLPDGYIIKRQGTFEIHTPEYEVAGNVPHGAPFRKKADAVLAAAAPELLEALLWQVELMGELDMDEHGGDITRQEWDDALHTSEAAIAKATREETR